MKRMRAFLFVSALFVGVLFALSMDSVSAQTVPTAEGFGELSQEDSELLLLFPDLLDLYLSEECLRPSPWYPGFSSVVCTYGAGGNYLGQNPYVASPVPTQAPLQAPKPK